jgi:hypothetical protein
VDDRSRRYLAVDCPADEGPQTTRLRRSELRTKRPETDCERPDRGAKR